MTPTPPTVRSDPLESSFFKIVNTSRDRLLATNAVVATGRAERRRGLIGRAEMGRDEALVIERCRQVHSFRMRFPIDVLFLDKDGTVLRALAGFSPGRLSPLAWRSRVVIEMPGGTIERTGTSRGDVVEIEPRATPTRPGPRGPPGVRSS